MKLVIIGHRGVGKSALLKRLTDYFSLPTYDLDSYISEKENKSIQDVFLEKGEDHFRQLETAYFSDLITKNEFIISVGGGFEVELIPEDVETVYVSRRTDSEGRIFLNRPRLNPELTAIEESISRYQSREPRFRHCADWVYHMPEGLLDLSSYEEKIFAKNFTLEKTYFTLQNKYELKIWPNINRFELRTDNFSLPEIKQIIQSEPHKNFIVSIRLSVYDLSELKDLKFDWALELGEPPENFKPAIVSIHQGHFNDALNRINQYADKNIFLKFCPEISTWNELQQGYEWMMQAPESRCFLPRTNFCKFSKSLWRWFRILMFKRQKINFVQGHKDLDDQPSLFEYLQNQATPIDRNFGAVLGFPIHHSRTPVAHADNLKDYGDVIAIPSTEKDFTQALKFLEMLGLKFGAVTSPLKLKAAELVHKNEVSEGINTIYFLKNSWVGTSTDSAGLKKLIETLDQDDWQNLDVVIWGGNGVNAAVKKILPQAIEYSSRTGNSKVQQTVISPHVLIWAAPRHQDTQMPPLEWQPKYILDLNYAENSMGLDYAQLKPESKYYSGEIMFYGQSKKQLGFWFDQILNESENNN